MIATTTTTEMIMAMMVIVHMYDDGDVDDGDAFLVSWHRCIDLISLYMHAPSGLTREARLLSTCLKQAGQ